MSINGVSSNTAASYTTSTTAAPNAASNVSTDGSKSSENSAVTPAAVYEKSGETSTKAKTYKPDAQKVSSMMAEAQQKVDDFKTLIQNIFKKQGQTVGDILSRMANGENIDLLNIDADTQAKAKEAIGEDGYYGVKNTAERILEFATALSGGNPKSVEQLRKGFIDGFNYVKDLFGGKLPDISEETYTKVMEGFDKMAKGEDWKTQTVDTK